MTSFLDDLSDNVFYQFASLMSRNNIFFSVQQKPSKYMTTCEIQERLWKACFRYRERGKNSEWKREKERGKER